MTDPITVIGLVSGIITFVDFGFKIVSGTRQIRDSGKGTTHELVELDSIIADVPRSTSTVKTQSNGRKQSADDLRLCQMANECEILCAQLSVIVSKSTARNTSLFESGRIAMKTILEKSEIQDMRKRLGILSQQIGLALQYVLQE